MCIVLAIAIVLATTYSVFLLTRKVKRGRPIRRVIKWRLHRCCYVIQSSVAIALLLVIGIIGAQGIFGENIINSSVHATDDEQSTPQTISNNIDTILLLQEDERADLTIQEKVDTLQVVANIESHYLGLPNELNIGAANLGEYTLARYNDRTHTISIDLNQLEYSSAHDTLKSCLHEAFHSYQHRLVEAYNATDEDLKGLRIYRAADQYRQEFNNYVDGDNDFDSYYFQDCEMDARDYAESGVDDYYTRIDKYLSGQMN